MAEIEGRLIFGAFEKDGEVFPSVHESCEICSYVTSRIVDVGFCGPEIAFLCNSVKQFVKNDDHCFGFDLNTSALSDEAEEEYYRLEEAGQLYSSDLSEEEIEAFEAL